MKKLIVFIYLLARHAKARVPFPEKRSGNFLAVMLRTCFTPVLVGFTPGKKLVLLGESVCLLCGSVSGKENDPDGQ